MRIFKLPTLAAALIALSGCFVLESSKAPANSDKDVEEHLIAYNYGWNLFGCVPIVCGNRNRDSWCPFVFFRNDVKHEYVHQWLQDYAKEKGVKLDDVMCIDDRVVFFDFYYAPIPWIVQYKEINYSAMTVKGGAK